MLIRKLYAVRAAVTFFLLFFVRRTNQGEVDSKFFTFQTVNRTKNRPTAAGGSDDIFASFTHYFEDVKVASSMQMSQGHLKKHEHKNTES